MQDPKSLSEAATLEEVLGLLDRLERQAISVGEFCSLYESMWNFQIDKESFSATSYDLLDKLFDEVAWFCPLPRAQWEYPKYRDEHEIRQAVASTHKAITREQ